MIATQLVDELTASSRTHGDLDVTVSRGPYEYPLRHLGFVPKGQMPFNWDVRKNSKSTGSLYDGTPKQYYLISPS